MGRITGGRSSGCPFGGWGGEVNRLVEQMGEAVVVVEQVADASFDEPQVAGVCVGPRANGSERDHVSTVQVQGGIGEHEPNFFSHLGKQHTFSVTRVIPKDLALVLHAIPLHYGRAAG